MKTSTATVLSTPDAAIAGGGMVRLPGITDWVQILLPAIQPVKPLRVALVRAFLFTESLKVRTIWSGIQTGKTYR